MMSYKSIQALHCLGMLMQEHRLKTRGIDGTSDKGHNNWMESFDINTKPLN